MNSQAVRASPPRWYRWAWQRFCLALSYQGKPLVSSSCLLKHLAIRLSVYATLIFALPAFVKPSQGWKWAAIKQRSKMKVQGQWEESAASTQQGWNSMVVEANSLPYALRGGIIKDATRSILKDESEGLLLSPLTSSLPLVFPLAVIKLWRCYRPCGEDTGRALASSEICPCYPAAAGTLSEVWAQCVVAEQWCVRVGLRGHTIIICRAALADIIYTVLFLCSFGEWLK